MGRNPARHLSGGAALQVGLRAAMDHREPGMGVPFDLVDPVDILRGPDDLFWT